MTLSSYAVNGTQFIEERAHSQLAQGSSLGWPLEIKNNLFSWFFIM
jgi:hypothetical protein